jgi:EthD domain
MARQCDRRNGPVIKLVFCCRRRAELTAEEFQEYWLNSHADLVRSVRAAIPTMTRYVQSHTVFGPLTDGVRDSRGTGEPYDGVAEVWLDFDATADDPEAMAAAMQRLLDDELTFVDMPRSSVFIAEEHVIF